MLDRDKIREEAVRVADLMQNTPSVMVHQIGQFCYLKQEGGGPHIRFRTEFPGDLIKEDDVHYLAALFTELSGRIESKHAEGKRLADALAAQETKPRGRNAAQNQA